MRRAWLLLLLLACGCSWAKKPYANDPLIRNRRAVIANPIDGDQLARDPAVGVAYFADPLVQPRSTARLGAELFAAMKRGRSGLDRLHVPTLVIHGGDDVLVPTAGSEPLGKLPGVERRVLPNLRHETLNEPEGPEVVAGIVEWLRTHV